jgi:hypothetical protein
VQRAVGERHEAAVFGQERDLDEIARFGREQRQDHEAEPVDGQTQGDGAGDGVGAVARRPALGPRAQARAHADHVADDQAGDDQGQVDAQPAAHDLPPPLPVEARVAEVVVQEAVGQEARQVGGLPPERDAVRERPYDDEGERAGQHDDHGDCEQPSHHVSSERSPRARQGRRR